MSVEGASQGEGEAQGGVQGAGHEAGSGTSFVFVSPVRGKPFRVRLSSILTLNSPPGVLPKLT